MASPDQTPSRPQPNPDSSGASLNEALASLDAALPASRAGRRRRGDPSGAIEPAEPGEPRSRPLPVGPREPFVPDLSGPASDEQRPLGSDRTDELTAEAAARRGLTLGGAPSAFGEADVARQPAVAGRRVDDIVAGTMPADALVSAPQASHSPAPESVGVRPRVSVSPPMVSPAVNAAVGSAAEERIGVEEVGDLNRTDRVFLERIVDHHGDLLEAMRAGVRRPEDATPEEYGLLQEKRFPNQSEAIAFLVDGVIGGNLTSNFINNLPPGLREQVSAAYDARVASQGESDSDVAPEPLVGPVSSVSPTPVPAVETGEPGLGVVEQGPAVAVTPEPAAAEPDPVENRGRELGARLAEASEGGEPTMRDLVTALHGMEGDPLRGATGGAAEMRGVSFLAESLFQERLPRTGVFLNSLGSETRDALISRLEARPATRALAGELRASYEEYVAANRPPLGDPGGLDDSIVARPVEPLRAPTYWAPPPLIRPRRANETELSSNDLTPDDYLRILSRTDRLFDDHGAPIDDSLRNIFADRIPGGERMTDREIARRLANAIGDEGRRPEDFDGLRNLLGAESRRDMWNFLNENLTAQIDLGRSDLGRVLEGWRRFFQRERDERIHRGGESAVRELVVDYDGITSGRDRKIRRGQILDALVDMNSLSNLPRILDQIRNDKDRRAIEKEFYRIARIHVLNDTYDPRYEAWAESDWYRRMQAAEEDTFGARIKRRLGLAGSSSSEQRGVVQPGTTANTEDTTNIEASPASRAIVEDADSPAGESMPESAAPFSRYLETLEGAARLDHPLDANNLGEGTENEGRIRITNTEDLPPVLRSITLQQAFRDELSSDTPEDINRLVGQITDSMVRSRVQERDLRRFLHLISDPAQRQLITENFFNRIRNIQLTVSDSPSVHGWRDMWRENQDYINDSVNRIISGNVQPSREFLAGRPDELQRVMDNLEAKLQRDPSLMSEYVRNEWLTYAQDIKEEEVRRRQAREEYGQNNERRDQLFSEIRESVRGVSTDQFNRQMAIDMVERARELAERGGINAENNRMLTDMMTRSLNESPDDAPRLMIGRYILGQSEQAVNEGRYDDAESFLDATEILGLDLNNNIAGLEAKNIREMRGYIQTQRR